jgi:MoaA/NifB/PqqE/SkfB family radical SAM enzyme
MVGNTRRHPRYPETAMNALDKAIRILPNSLYLEPISACNLHCKMCYTNVINGANRRVVEADVVLDFVRRFVAATPPPVDVYWCGTGELFMHRDFPRMVNRILADYPEAIPTQTIQTNGTLNRLKEFDSLERLNFNVSIDGSRPFHEWHRGENTYDKTLDFCRDAVDRGARELAVRMLLTRDNIHYLDEFAAELRERIGPKVDLRLSAPYTNPALRAVRGTALAINQQDIEDATALDPDEAERIFAEKYQNRYYLDQSAEAVNNYLSLTTYGIYTCCHGILNIGDHGADIETLRERMKASEEDCRSCAMFPCM